MMSAAAANAASQMGHRLGAEADNATSEHERSVKRWMSDAWHEFALRVQGIDPAQRAAEQQAAQGGGLSVQKEDAPDEPPGDFTGASERLDVVKENAPAQPDPSSPGMP